MPFIKSLLQPDIPVWSYDVYISCEPLFCCWKDQSLNDAEKSTGDGGGGGGWWTVELESVETVYLGRGEAITALERSCPRQ